MAVAPKYFDTAKVAHCRLTAGNAATDGSGTPTDFTWYNTAPVGDWMLTKMIISASSATAVGNPADCFVTIFVDDATTPRKIRTVDLGDPAVGAVGTPEFQVEVSFGPEFVFGSSMNLAALLSVTPTAGNIDIVAFVQAA